MGHERKFKMDIRYKRGERLTMKTLSFTFFLNCLLSQLQTLQAAGV